MCMCNLYEESSKRLAINSKKYPISKSYRNEVIMKMSLPQQTAKSGLHSRKVLLSVWWDYSRNPLSRTTSN